ncbi:MAG: exonuclease SbcCD subunit D C-terminal domain-containing protein, partial [Clostridiales bacterium]|nr:exonuclease SbcCD subunit D C-terminal domain-containing protein [Clostridiales bacterium]
IDLTDEEDIPNAAARLTQRFPNLLALRYDNKRTRSFGTTDSPEEVVEKTPMEQMKALYRFIQNSEMSEEAVRFVEKTMKKVEGMQA